MPNLNPYINFNGNCREAMTFYRDCLGGNLDLQTIGGSPIEQHCPAAMKDQILHSSLVKDGFMLMGSDMNGMEEYAHGNTISLNLNCTSEEEINKYYNNISQGGKVIDPLGVKFWGAVFGVVKDKFGVRWMFHYDKNQNN